MIIVVRAKLFMAPIKRKTGVMKEMKITGSL